ncbi:MAG TPA: ribbon-helix-helix protein, CopG family [Rhizomicrobium sp.]
MRTTLTLDPDNAARLERMRKDRDASLKEVVNDAIRRGLDALDAPAKARNRTLPEPIDLGPFLYPSVKEALAALDEEDDRRKLGLP